MEPILTALKAVAEPTRLRLLALCGCAELSVGELVDIIGQSQPRISRHLKLLVEGGLLERAQEGAYVFYRLRDQGESADLARSILDMLPLNDAILDQDTRQLAVIRERREEEARNFFARNAENWAEIRSLHVDPTLVDEAFLETLSKQNVGRLIDLGCGDGHVMQIAADLTDHATGIDVQPEMLRVARTQIDRMNKPGFHVQQADMGHLPFPDSSFDTSTIFMALRHVKQPDQAIAEAGRVLRPGGTLHIVDFAAHDMASLRERHAHEWLGFQEDQIKEWGAQAGLRLEEVRSVYHGAIPVMIWSVQKCDPSLEY